MFPHVHCICVITPNLLMTSQPLHGRYYMRYICDIIPPMFLTKYPLRMTSQHSVLMSPHSAYVWHPLHCRWYHTTLSRQTTLFMMSHPLHASHHTPISDIAPTVSLSSQPLHWYHTHFWMTSHPPSVWHSMPYIEHHILSLCHHSTFHKHTPISTPTQACFKSTVLCSPWWAGEAGPSPRELVVWGETRN